MDGTGHLESSSVLCVHAQLHESTHSCEHGPHRELKEKTERTHAFFQVPVEYGNQETLSIMMLF